MSIPSVTDATMLPPSIQEALDTGVLRLRAALGDRLRTVTLFGSAARGLFDPAHSDVNLLIVLSDPSPAAVQSLAEALAPLAAQVRLSPYVIGADELPMVARLFPTRILEMKRGYRVLCGADLLAGQAEDRAALAQRVQAELLNELLRLRNLLAAASSAEARAAAVRMVFAPYLKTLRTLIQLRTGEHLENRAAVLTRACELYGIALAPLRQLLQWREGRVSFQGAEWDELSAGLLESIGQTARASHE